MKNFKLILPTILYLISTTVSACGSHCRPAWDDGAVIANGKKYKVDLQLQDVEKHFVVNNKLFVAGYQIDSSGINHSTVAWFNEDYSKTSYKRFENFIQDIFEYENSSYLLDSAGLVFSFDEKSWEQADIKLRKDSYVIYSHKDIIACQQASLFKSSKQRGSCYSMNKGWSVDVHWHDIRPKMCDGVLKAIGTIEKDSVAWKIDVETGNLKVKKVIKKSLSDPCKVLF